MKLRPETEPRVRRASANELVQRPSELGPYAEALSLTDKMRESIKQEFDTPTPWFPRGLREWADIKWIDPSFDIPEISSEQIRTKLFSHIDDSEKDINKQADNNAKVYEITCWILEYASKAITLRPELYADIIQRVQPHIDTVLKRLERMEYPVDSEGARDLTTILIHLQTFGSEVREIIKPLIKKFESPALEMLTRMAEKEILTQDEQAELLVNAGLLRLVHPGRQTEIQSIALPKVGDYNELSTDASNRLVILLFRLLLHSPKVTLLPSGNLEMTLPPEAIPQSKPLPERPAV